jgi:hypothetical protein
MPIERPHLSSGDAFERGIAPLLFALGLASAAGCGGGSDAADAPVRSDTAATSAARVSAAWVVRCGALMDCDGNPSRTLEATDGQGGAVVECAAPRVGAGRSLDIRLEQRSEFGIVLSGAETSPTGGRVGGAGCTVEVLESAETLSLRGPCSANPPSPDAPCQVQRVDIDEAERSVSLELRCEGLGTGDGSGVVREITDPDTSAGFVEIQLSECRL